MTDLNEVELAREFVQRGLTRREILSTGTRLGLTSASIGAVLALSGKEADAAGRAGRAVSAPTRHQESIFDKTAGAEGPWPQSVVPEPTEKITLSVAHA